MGGDFGYEVAQEAYLKLCLHAVKHRSAAVNGLLVGRLVSPNTVYITDAVPLSHSPGGLALLPTLEIALTQVEEHFGSDGLSVVGYYHANERHDDHDLGVIAKKIADHVFRYFPHAAILLLDNEKLGEVLKGKGKNAAVQLYTKDSSKGWRPSGSDGSSQLVLKQPSANAVLADYVSTEKWQAIVDFNDHLDDISQDWLNSSLFK